MQAALTRPPYAVGAGAEGRCAQEEREVEVSGDGCVARIDGAQKPSPHWIADHPGYFKNGVQMIRRPVDDPRLDPPVGQDERSLVNGLFERSGYHRRRAPPEVVQNHASMVPPVESWHCAVPPPSGPTPGSLSLKRQNMLVPRSPESVLVI